MPPRLIINADDFGLTLGVNRAIRELYEAGALTSATLMATGSAFDDAVAVSRSNPSLGVGCHITLTDGIPVSHPESIPSLIGSDRRSLRPSLVDFVQALLRGQIREEDIEREAQAQVNKLQLAGVDVTHIDTHKHTHLFPGITRPLLRVATRCSIRAIRNPFEQPWSLALGHGNRLRRLQVKLLSSLERKFEQQSQIRSTQVYADEVHADQEHAGQVRTTDGTIGISATGRLTAETLRQILQALPPDGTFELCCHPGYNDRDLDRVTTRLRTHREIERWALLNEVPFAARQPNAPQLIHYGNLSGLEKICEADTFIPGKRR